jgi:CubicO group peptidase (beta-lactamase class C family)
MTKPVASVALMQLVEQGRLGLDDPAEKYLPELAGLKVFEPFDPASGAYQLRPASRPPTVRQFLTHTSGLGYPFTSAILRDFKPRVPGKRSPGSLSWGGINNTFFWIDPARGIAGVIMMQYLPFADAKALATYDAFERGAYQLVHAER